MLPFAIWVRYQEFTRNLADGITTIYSFDSAGTYAQMPATLQTLQVDISRSLLDVLGEFMPIALLLYAVVPAMALLHYLYQSRSVLGTHALPVTRAQLFVTHYLAGIAMAVLPLLIFCAVTVPLLLIIGVFPPQALLLFCVGSLGMYLFFFSFAVFCGMFTGQLWGLPAFYAIFNAIALITFFIFATLADNFLYGFTLPESSEGIVRALTPVWQFTEVLELESINATGAFTFLGLDTLAIYVVIGLLFAAAAYAIFTNRHLERAGEIVSVNVMRPVFSIGLGLYGGFCALMLCNSVLYIDNVFGLFAFLVVGVLVGFGAGKMLLEKTIAVLTLRNLTQLCALVAVACLLFSTVYYDLLGYETYLPELDEVDRIDVSMGLYADQFYFYSSQALPAESAAQKELMLNAHAAIMASYQETGDEYYRPTPEITVTTEVITTPDTVADGEADAVADAANGDALSDYAYAETSYTVTLTYHMNNGQAITRSYWVWATEEELAREGSATAYLEAFVQSFDVAEVIEANAAEYGVELYDYDTGDSISAAANSALSAATLEAILADIDAQGTTFSILRKAYSAAENMSIYLDLPVIKNGETIYFTSATRVIVLPGTYTEALCLEKLG